MDSTTAMQNEEEYAVQEPAWTYYERLSLALGCDSGSIGISSDMTLPDWYSGCFVNDKDRLKINVIGDSLQLRQMLEDMLKGDEFDMGVGLYSRNEQRAVTDSLLKAVERDSLRMNMSCGSNVDGTVHVTLEASGDSVIEAFRKDVFDSPLLRFKLADKVGIIFEKEEIEVNEKQADEQSYVDYEIRPQFPGGETAMISYIYDNLRYPEEAYNENIQGRVVVQFLIDVTGNVDSVKVVKNKDADLDAEAVRIVRSFPNLLLANLIRFPLING
ncbi:energy transducer TonB [Duncaniella dubosii]|jgi:TonB family protein|uniref:energy transducer TonB n=1 Tax=Duncaniella dubosii TaxID=2518971 RepID=UPI0025B1D060|nr:energy transducer TonB [uncultured Duncaniella sp.]